MRDLADTIKKINVYTTGIPEERERKGQRDYLKKISEI